MMTCCMLWCDDILLCTMMCTFYMHITCWWWWWVFDDDDSTYPTTLMYNLWWCSAIAKQRYFSDCGWQWTVCSSRFRDWYVTDLQVVQCGTECVSISDKADLAVNSEHRLLAARSSLHRTDLLKGQASNQQYWWAAWSAWPWWHEQKNDMTVLTTEKIW